MNQNLAFADYAVFIIYFIVVSAYGYTVYRKRKQDEQDAKAYFLAEGNLTWWAIGASLIASNISAEQFIGMSGEGFFLGIAVAAYEWLAAIALIIVAVWFIPVYLKNKIYTMPQFLKTRYNESTALIMAVFWLFLYVFVNLTSILYLGAVAINGLAGGEYLHVIMIGLAVFALFISLGGMKVVAYTDVIQVAVLIIGGLVTSYIALTTVGQYFGVGENAIAGFKVLMKEAPEHFKMIIPKPTANSSQIEIDKYLTFPGLMSYLAGIWIINLNYWGCNQYITQRALGADLQTARTGILFAGMLKLLMPLIVMLPGIAAYVLYTNGHLPQLVGGKDGAYSAVLTFLPTGLKGLSVAALTAAIVASLAGKVNSISTIYTLDIHKKYIQKDAGEKQQVNIGRIAVFAAMLLAVLFTWNDILGIGGVGGFTYIQKYTGFISPGVFAMFFLGMFWKRTTGTAAIVGVILGFVLSVLFNEYAPALFGNETLLYTAYNNGKGAFEIPFHICMGLSFFFTMLVMIAISFAGPKVNPKAFEIDAEMFKVKPQTTVLIVITLLVIVALYVKFW
ncbi:sodium/sugar symporter [Flavobacterium bizetiae]|uniref:Sodium/glucose cotransporter n=1 Tax=Flavobacterium bizetiae TaxID=2704140 RepID=A0A6N3IZ27_9FLAO|nr:sodium/sugar symporter [Flavobacterium bizetiae]UTN05401.1 sodium/sugar symporter [Flavobacterium bizetiae]CAA9199800.1 Sodium/glucose cotransporter [Flavobacterium bizetiae]CAD5343809.1 Sodium/glucose cotransporter [Flavobacterium bizetiae]CAD5349755.1 Sodium/glucose cotransporter [Flavobacterium bizetiae]